MHKLMMWLTKRLKAREICIHDEPYLERYYLGTLFGKRFFIHRFMDKDPDRGLHDHPWRWAFSIMLAGSYNEIFARELTDELKIVDTRTKKAPAFNFIDGGKLHRVTMDDKYKGKTWTLFVHGPRDREWGFLEYETYTTEINGDTGIIIDETYHKADTPEERKENEAWYLRKDTLRGKDMRAARETYNILKEK